MMQQRSSKLLRAAAATLLGMAPLSAFACNAEPYIGSVCTFAFDWCPRGYLPADGRQLPTSGNQAIFSLIGFTYGGNGSTMFNLPDLRGRTPVGTGTSDYGVTTRIAQKGGSATATLNTNNVPAHLHPATGSLAAGSVSNGTLTLPVSGGTVTGQTISGAVTVNALNGANPPGAGVAVPTSSANSIGKVGPGSVAFYPQGTNPVAVPTSHNLSVSGGTLAGASASGTVSLPANNTAVAVTVGPNTTSQPAPVATISPNLGMSVCIAVNGLYPDRP